MKKTGIVLCGILCWTCSGKKSINQIFIPEQYQQMYDMGQRIEIYDEWTKVDPLVTYDRFLYNNDTLAYVLFISPNLLIRDVFTGKEVANVYDKSSSSDKEKFALYTLSCGRRTRQLLLFNKGEFTVFSGDAYPQVLKGIVSYFEKHKDLDERLLPLCIQEITKIHVNNQLDYDDYGPWRHWWDEEADSLGLIYNQHLRWN